jgi:hypothetical protein
MSMPGIAEFLAEGPYKLIVTELPADAVMLTFIDTITADRACLTLRSRVAHETLASDPIRVSPGDQMRKGRRFHAFSHGVA